MSTLEWPAAILLGLVQGLTEFLPVSSSGHLVVTQQWLGLQSESPPMLLFDVCSHLGTLLAVTIVFLPTFRDFLARMFMELHSSYRGKRTACLITMLGVVASVPTAAIGIGFKNTFERAFSSILATGFALLVTGCLLFITGLIPRPKRGWRRMSFWRVAVVGIAQGMAILPGISRSGSTICTAQMVGLKRRWSAQFSFFIAVPAIVGAALIKLRDTIDLPSEALATTPWFAIAVGTLVSFVSGVFALRWLLAAVNTNRLSTFCYYCWAVGAAVVVWGITSTP